MANASIGIWARALRLPFLSATMVPVILGTSIAWFENGTFDLVLFLLAILGVASLHLAANTSNDYYDHLSGNDLANKRPTKFSGGSRVIQDKLLRPEQVRNASIFFLIVGVGIGAILYCMTKNTLILWIGGLGVFIGFFYTAPPFKLGYRGVGEIVTGIGFGPLAVVGAHTLQSEVFSVTALAASIPIGLLVALILLINEVPDEEADKKVGKHTLVVILGKREAISLYHFFLIATYLFIMTGILIGHIPLYAIVVLLTLPLSVKAFNASTQYINDKRQDVRKLLPANGMTIALHMAIGMLLSLSYVLASFF